VKRTLQAYISRDLMKVTVLALVAFTLVLTVLGIIKPLRKEGLGSGQITLLFGYTLPWVLSFTLPVAALFAGTIVYGRFSQDNELTACRASGISTITLLKPALVLGAIVTLISIVLVNFVAPKMTELLARSFKANVMGIAARKLRMQNYLKRRKQDSRGVWRTRVVHADAVFQKDNKLTLYGVVAAESKELGAVRVLAASKAYAQFITGDDETYVMVHLIDPVIMQAGGKRIARAKNQPFLLSVANLAEEKPSWYNWNKLMRAWAKPEVNAEIRGIIKRVRREMCHDIFHRDIVQALRGGGSYQKLRDERNTYAISAPRATLGPDHTVVLSSSQEADAYRPVQVTVMRDGREQTVATGDIGRVWVTPDLFTGKSAVAIKLVGSVRVMDRTENAENVTRSTWEVGGLAIPPEILGQGEKVAMGDMLAGKKLIGSGLKYLPRLKSRIAKLKRKILAQMHTRVAFAVSCFLLVGLGSALGLIFRGGQMITAFAISVVPLAIVFILIMNGKRMMTNADVDLNQGILVIWVGIIGLLVAKVIIYVRLSRQ